MKKILIGLLVLGSISIFAQEITLQVKTETEILQIKCRNEINNLLIYVKENGQRLDDEKLDLFVEVVEMQCSAFGQSVERNSYNPQ